MSYFKSCFREHVEVVEVKALRTTNRRGLVILHCFPRASVAWRPATTRIQLGSEIGKLVGPGLVPQLSAKSPNNHHKIYHKCKKNSELGLCLSIRRLQLQLLMR
jgi:hypothetical protein